MSRLVANVHQNQYLPVGGSQVSAVITVSSTGWTDASVPPRAAEIVIVGTSGSMEVPRVKMKAAREATRVAIDTIRDGVAFAVIAGTHRAEHVFPASGGMALASAATRQEAKEVVGRLPSGGGSAIGAWLTLARDLFESGPGGICHAILLADGENRDETAEQLDATLSLCEGRFQCDCRGVGTDWQVSELRRVASVLLGTVDIIPEPAAMAADFRSMMEAATRKLTAAVSLRVWTPRHAEVALLRQVAPAIAELTDRATAVDALTADYPTGSWGEESRDFHLCINVQPRNVGDEMLAARVSLVEGVAVLAQGLIKAIWTDDEQLSTRIDREVAHHTGQAELAECIQGGLEARSAGDEATATFKLGRAVALATQSANAGTLKLLRAVVDVDDAASGTVRLRRDVADADEMVLDTRSTRTVRVRPAR